MGNDVDDAPIRGWWVPPSGDLFRVDARGWAVPFGVDEPDDADDER
jgi:hypothetical protein